MKTKRKYKYPSSIRLKDKEGRGGITIRINRPGLVESNHLSEISLDKVTDWDYVINNDRDILNLIEQVREILKKENII